MMMINIPDCKQRLLLILNLFNASTFNPLGSLSSTEDKTNNKKENTAESESEIYKSCLPEYECKVQIFLP